jgi:hypothetical protein
MVDQEFYADSKCENRLIIGQIVYIILTLKHPLTVNKKCF